MNKRADAAGRIASNWQRVVDRANEAATAAGRDPRSVRIVGVSKYADAPLTAALVAAGCHDLGESRPQALWSKAAEIDNAAVRWHLVGHLQRNKARRTVPLVWLIHSVDSLRLAETINSEAAAESGAAGGAVRGLLEVNISGDTAKHGLAPEAVPAAVEAVGQLPHLRIVGLMGMAARGSNAAAARRTFESLRSLRDRVVESGLPDGVIMDELSMGMSGDFPQAIGAGATIVRIGSSLFEGVEVG